MQKCQLCGAKREKHRQLDYKGDEILDSLILDDYDEHHDDWMYVCCSCALSNLDNVCDCRDCQTVVKQLVK